MKRLFLACGFAAATVTACSPAHACFSEGIRTGVIQKLSHKGLLVKSYEGELVMDGFRIRGASSHRSSGNIWQFSARDAAVGRQLEEAMQAQRQVSVKYCQEYFSLTTDTPYIITSVTLLKN